MSVIQSVTASESGKDLLSRFQATRAQSEQLCKPLSPEDMTVQTMPDVSPSKWHLAHTSWFFERFLLQELAPDYRVFHPRFDYLFNSYYFTLGQMFQRPRRGLLSRPGVSEILDYRAHVDAAMATLIRERGDEPAVARLVILGINHEQQHQELILTDIKHVLGSNPLWPAYHDKAPSTASPPEALQFHAGVDGIHSIGYQGDDFHFDNEGPGHQVLIRPHTLAHRLITNGEYRDFIRDGGYQDPALWLSDGWSTVQNEGWNRPLYWGEDLETLFTLAGPQPLDPHAPVCHVSFYEAEAFARWAGYRLATEAEWELAARQQSPQGNFQDDGLFQPRGLEKDRGKLGQLYGDVWEWTASPYAPYPGYEPPKGPVGEYNGKFMCNQMVLRGGSCATPQDHIRASYRNFFYPHSRWQFSGIRLAKDLPG
ncbi:ergothioneine biosynthesis protein EgtB [Natronospira proteinivora]|uniref:Ergothioneine biosynthesis protein EgtB n=1 Tax=Natronospira proteinivora TaxID=1807133 RepID=A0ABT1GB41_9GAMM|nr:ergothioneine biosynthesis protein EgtB [Natronospira proteinivora]MCP1728539.1 ergothioneine biosynthesis protein EgtB [Natronospira proteinivora]